MKNLYANIRKYYFKIVNGENLQYVISNILFVFLGVFISTSYILVDNIHHDITSSENTIHILNTTYNGYVDKDVFCRSIDCAYIGGVNSNIVLDINTLEDIVVTTNIFSIGNVYWANGVFYGLEHNEDVYYLDITDNIFNTLYPTLFIMFVSLITILKILGRTLTDKNITSMDLLKNSEYLNKYDTLFGLTSNINHEVSTPLNVINSVFADFKYTNDEFIEYLNTPNSLPCTNGVGIELLECVNNNMRDMIKENLELSKENVELGMIAVRQIYDELSAINDYKNIAVVENESIYTLINTAVKMLNKLSVIDIYDCTIDKDFHNLKLNNSVGMSNMLFVSIIINHLKNSIEANANKITIMYVDGCININDNGNGVPKDLAERIFENDFSTKDSTDILRGNGLFINKLLLNGKYEGDISLVKSIPNVITTFCLKIKLERKEDG